MSENWQLILINSEYATASDEVNNQVTQLNEILDRYDPKGMLIGEAPCTKDLITITDHDFNVVNWVSIGFIFAIIFFVFGSVTLPFLLVLVIEFAIFINLGIPGFTGTKLPFVASIVIGTIQLGSTVDYAILMTSRYQSERAAGKGREESVRIAHLTSIQSIIVSAFSFFAATFGVGIYSNIEMISSLCILMARGALISMVTAEAPASMAFSVSSLTTEAGRSITSPAAILLIVSLSRSCMLISVLSGCFLQPVQHVQRFDGRHPRKIRIQDLLLHRTGSGLRRCGLRDVEQ